MTIKFTLNEKNLPANKLADAELVFETGELSGLRLIGFGLWIDKRNKDRVNVTFPARTYSVNGERRSFSLLRPTEDIAGGDRLTRIILEEFKRQTGATFVV